jgi:DNA gyrase subunit A
MQLRQLTRLSRIDLEKELADLRERMIELQRILDDPAVLRGVIKDEMTAIRDEFGSRASAPSSSTPAR